MFKTTWLGLENYTPNWKTQSNWSRFLTHDPTLPDTKQLPTKNVVTSQLLRLACETATYQRCGQAFLFCNSWGWYCYQLQKLPKRTPLLIFQRILSKNVLIHFTIILYLDQMLYQETSVSMTQVFSEIMTLLKRNLIDILRENCVQTKMASVLQ